MNELDEQAIINPEKVKYFYLRYKKFPVACLATNVITNEDSTRTVHFNISMYNPKDKFSKKIAKDIALQRLINSPYTFITVGTPGIVRHMTIKNLQRTCAGKLSAKTVLAIYDYLDSKMNSFDSHLVKASYLRKQNDCANQETLL